ncbi:MAG: class I SAM-dependent methyltransferase [Sneathiella sp.]|nr:class I SAM-dependent methyltransferase [Sneathiella sp.]
MKKASNWLTKHYHHILSGGSVLDLACGRGRHSAFLEKKGFQVTAVDIDTKAIEAAGLKATAVIQADLENGVWPFNSDQFDGIVVVNYLYRAHFPKLINALKPGGVLIFDTYMVGNEQFGRPANPKFLLKSSELDDAFSDFEVVAFDEGYVECPVPAMRQSIVARKRF